MRHPSHRTLLFGYGILVLGGVSLGWNIAQFWSYANYTLDFVVNEILLCLCGVLVYLFFRGTRVKKGKNSEGNNASNI
jgi:hypothetical protein